MVAAANPITVPLINGTLYSFAHIKLVIAGLEFTGGFKSIDYERTRKRDFPMSNSPDPVGKTLGENEYKCSAVVYLAWFMAMLQTVQQRVGGTFGYGDFSFPIICSYNAVGFPPFVDTIQNCTIDSTKVTQAAGTGALERSIDFNPTKILYNGYDDLANPLQPSAQ
jgi:hypothetical protein